MFVCNILENRFQINVCGKFNNGLKWRSFLWLKKNVSKILCIDIKNYLKKLVSNEINKIKFNKRKAKF